MKHPHIKTLKTTYGKVVRVSAKDLADQAMNRLPLYNQFGKPLKPDGPHMLKRPLAVYRENLVLPN